MSVDQPEVGLAFIDGRDALAAVIIRPNAAGDGVIIDANARGMSKEQGAYVLRHVADQWDPPKADPLRAGIKALIGRGVPADIAGELYALLDRTAPGGAR